jgi:hypothetical protein
MLDIVGARFHCAICDSVDICANCESAGVGNLTSDDGGHDSSHIMIKVRHRSLLRPNIGFDASPRFLTRLNPPKCAAQVVERCIYGRDEMHLLSRTR